MAYVAPVAVTVGDAIKKERFDLYDANFADHEARLLSLASGSGTIELFNDEILIGSTATTFLSSIKDIEIMQACSVVEVALRIYTKSPATTGSITIDLKKNTTTNPTGFTSVLTTLPTLNIAACSDYQRTVGVINTSAQACAVGDILRLSISSLPVGLQKILVTIKGVY